MNLDNKLKLLIIFYFIVHVSTSSDKNGSYHIDPTNNHTQSLTSLDPQQDDMMFFNSSKHLNASREPANSVLSNFSLSFNRLIPSLPKR